MVVTTGSTTGKTPAPPAEFEPARPGTAGASPARAIVSRESLLALAVVAALVEFLALRVITRVGEFLPGDGWRGPLLVTMFLGLAALNVAAIAAALAALSAARVMVTGHIPARIVGAVVALAVGLNVLASIPGLDVPAWPRAVVTIAALFALAVAPYAFASTPGLDVAVRSRSIAKFAALIQPAIAPIRLAMAAIGLALVPGMLADGGDVGSAGVLRVTVEVLAIGAALSAPFALSRRPGRGAIVAGVVAATLTLALILGRPTTASSFAMWSLSFALWLPAPIYALAAGALAATLVEGLRHAETRRVALALALVALAGIRPEATYPALLALAAGTALVDPRPKLLSAPE